MRWVARSEIASICAVVVTHQPDTGLPDRIARMWSLASGVIRVPVVELPPPEHRAYAIYFTPVKA